MDFYVRHGPPNGIVRLFTFFRFLLRYSKTITQVSPTNPPRRSIILFSSLIKLIEIFVAQSGEFILTRRVWKVDERVKRANWRTIKVPELYLVVLRFFFIFQVTFFLLFFFTSLFFLFFLILFNFFFLRIWLTKKREKVRRKNWTRTEKRLFAKIAKMVLRKKERKTVKSEGWRLRRTL